MYFATKPFFCLCVVFFVAEDTFFFGALYAQAELRSEAIKKVDETKKWGDF